MASETWPQRRRSAAHRPPRPARATERARQDAPRSPARGCWPARPAATSMKSRRGCEAARPHGTGFAQPISGTPARRTPTSGNSTCRSDRCGPAGSATPGPAAAPSDRQDGSPSSVRHLVHGQRARARANDEDWDARSGRSRQNAHTAVSRQGRREIAGSSTRRGATSPVAKNARMASAALAPTTAAQLLAGGAADAGDAAERVSSVLRRRGPTPAMSSSSDRRSRIARALAVERHREAVRLVADPLQQPQRRTMRASAIGSSRSRVKTSSSFLARPIATRFARPTSSSAA